MEFGKSQKNSSKISELSRKKNLEPKKLKISHKFQTNSDLLSEVNQSKKPQILSKREEKNLYAFDNTSPEIMNSHDSTLKQKEETRPEVSNKKKLQEKEEPLWKRTFESRKQEDEILKPFLNNYSMPPKKSATTQLQIFVNKPIIPQSQEKISWNRKKEEIKKDIIKESDQLMTNRRVIEKKDKIKMESTEKLSSIRSTKKNEIDMLPTELEQKQLTEDLPGVDETQELLCVICSELYDKEDHQPVLLPRCGHTFCRSCLMSIKGKGHFPCPTCRKRHLKPPIEDLPINNLVLQQAIAFQDDKRGKCLTHNNILLYWCHDCRTLLCSSCSVMDGHNVERSKIVLQVKRQELKEQGEASLHQLIHEKKILLDLTKISISQLIKVCERSIEVHESSKTVEDMMKDTKQRIDLSFVFKSIERIRKMFDPLTKADTSLFHFFTSNNNRKIVQGKPTWSELGNNSNIQMRREEIGTENKHEVAPQNLDMKGSNVKNQGPLLCLTDSSVWPLTSCVFSEDGRRARLSKHSGKLFMSALSEREKEAHFMIKLSVIQSIVPQENPEVFLEIEAGNQRLGRIYIKLWGHLRRAHHFLALCMGTHGPSYRGAKFEEVFSRGLKGECLHAGPYITPSGKLSAARVMDQLEWDGQFKGIQRKKLVVGAGSGRPERDACFDICTIENPNRYFACPFGEVVEGWDTVMSIIHYKAVRTVTMVDVGVVLPDSAFPIN